MTPPSTLTLPRRRLLQLLGGGVGLAAFSHTGSAIAQSAWTDVDETRPYYLSGTVTSADWHEPRARLVIEVPKALAAAPDFDPKQLPDQTASVDRAAIVNALTLPPDLFGAWQLELGTPARLAAWGLASPPAVGSIVAAIGYGAPDLRDGRRLRVEFLIADGRVLGLRSTPR